MLVCLVGSPGVGQDKLHKKVSFSVFLPGLRDMQPLFHGSVISAYEVIVAARAQVTSSDIEITRREGDETIVDFVVMCPPKGSYGSLLSIMYELPGPVTTLATGSLCELFLFLRQYLCWYLSRAGSRALRATESWGRGVCARELHHLLWPPGGRCR